MFFTYVCAYVCVPCWFKAKHHGITFLALDAASPSTLQLGCRRDTPPIFSVSTTRSPKLAWYGTCRHVDATTSVCSSTVADFVKKNTGKGKNTTLPHSCCCWCSAGGVDPYLSREASLICFCWALLPQLFVLALWR